MHQTGYHHAGGCYNHSTYNDWSNTGKVISAGPAGLFLAAHASLISQEGRDQSAQQGFRGAGPAPPMGTRAVGLTRLMGTATL